MKCFFSSVNGCCTILYGTKCDGEKYNCSFFKTEREYITERNNAILLNREKGNCKDCKYRSVKCELTELDNENEFIEKR